jgi:hypothetical protein
MHASLTEFRWRIEHDGFAVVPSGVSEHDLTQLTAALEHLAAERDLATRGGLRDAFRLVPGASTLATSAPLWRLASTVLGSACAAVRAIVFDKTPRANWKVSWHQDLTIAVRRRVDVAGFGPWSEKAGILHVQPPVAVLEQMLTLRLHLDSCGATNGPVRVLGGSHRSGRLAGEEMGRRRAEHETYACLAARGEVLAMRPLLLHASSTATSPAHRRVLHIEYAAVDLPAGLEWHEALRPTGFGAGAA